MYVVLCGTQVKINAIVTKFIKLLVLFYILLKNIMNYSKMWFILGIVACLCVPSTSQVSEAAVEQTTGGDVIDFATTQNPDADETTADPCDIGVNMYLQTKFYEIKSSCYDCWDVMGPWVPYQICKGLVSFTNFDKSAGTHTVITTKINTCMYVYSGSSSCGWTKLPALSRR